jgi:glycosyltransferase involved in cell wall biosynthesis
VPSVAFTGRAGVPVLEDRVRGLGARFPSDVTFVVDFHGGPGVSGAAAAFCGAIALARRHDVVWMCSQHPLRVLGACLGRLLYGTPFVVDTGDLLEESERTSGRGAVRLLTVRVLERLSLRLADAVVVRGSAHVPIAAGMGARRVVLVSDGVEPAAFARRDATALRAQLGVAGCPTVGVVSTIGVEPRLGLPSPGWDVVETVARLGDLAVIGLVVGDGPGLPRLREMARAHGVEDRVRFVPRVPLEAVPAYLSAIDVFVHTALNNPMSAVRTTGKLPQFLAAGCAAVVSRVGEAARVLEGTGMLLDFDGTPEDYAVRLAARVRALLEAGELARWREEGPGIARREFAYAVLGARAAALVRDLARR